MGPQRSHNGARTGPQQGHNGNTTGPRRDHNKATTGPQRGHNRAAPGPHTGRPRGHSRATTVPHQGHNRATTGPAMERHAATTATGHVWSLWSWPRPLLRLCQKGAPGLRGCTKALREEWRELAVVQEFPDEPPSGEQLITHLPCQVGHPGICRRAHAAEYEDLLGLTRALTSKACGAREASPVLQLRSLFTGGGGGTRRCV